ncbi:substrate-binding domain-containing protein [Geobacter sp. DSM 9736]|uniref:substrate-binding domain-containing protein n=1 Tax=Geobacter sp. DSM 9736 TaxID=1277350 RepID=UPI000B506EDE|nr:substrate-binding domain-containing protein [Geobacter sp. DSM 9736]SNB46852.1 phosphate transport system substrate-binding protein [Geobacter sp. DSM 9736]
MKKLYVVLAALCSLVLTSGTSRGEELVIGAGAAPTENVLKPVKDPFEKATGIRLTIISSGPKNALLEMDKGSVEAAAAGLSFQDWMKLMEKEGAPVKDPAALQQTVIGRDRIVVIVNKENPVTKLSREQLQGIFSGRTENWKDVGGSDTPVLIVWGKLIPGTNSMFSARVLDGTPVTTDLVEATTAEDVRQNIAANPSAIGIGPVAILDGSIKAVEAPEVTRDIVLVTKGKPSAKVQKLLTFIKGEGQKYIKQ